VRSYPGAAGTVINNLAALGVGRILPIAVIGDDGEGCELRQALEALRVVALEHVFSHHARRTPTYTKPMLQQAGQPPRELNRLDIKNRSPLPAGAEDKVIAALNAMWPQVDALLVLDQVSEAECGVVTSRVRHQLAELGDANPEKLILADSRERIAHFRSAWTKPNERECALIAGTNRTNCGPFSVEGCARELARRNQRPVFCTRGAEGILVASHDPSGAFRTAQVPAYPVAGPIDVVGAGDSTSAGIACALAGGATLEEAAAFGNLVASITIQQIGTTGTATLEQVRRRWREVHG